MANYNIDVVHRTFERLLGSELDVAELEEELVKQDWIPSIDQMIVIDNHENTLPNSTQYGRFIEFKDRKYRTTAGYGRFARSLTVAEIAQCF